MAEAMTGNDRQGMVDQVLHSDGSIFLEGPAGTGKTTLAVRRVLALLARGVPAEAILVLLPQRTLAAPYAEALRSPEVGPSGEVTVVTVDGLARRTISLFWPLIAERAGFAHPERPPSFLTLETAQYFMSRILEPLRERGYFAGISIRPNRLVGQILDNLNKAAIVGFSCTGIAQRLKEAWGEKAAVAASTTKPRSRPPSSGSTVWLTICLTSPFASKSSTGTSCLCQNVVTISSMVIGTS